MDNQFGRMYICSNIKIEKDLYTPAGITSDFNTQDKKVICFVRLNNINKEIQVRWKWYDPDSRLVRDTVQFDTLVNTREDFIMVQTLYDELDLTQIKKPLKGGVWTVVFYLENLLVGSMNFTLKNQAGKKKSPFSAENEPL
jgi:hypothetical protein